MTRKARETDPKVLVTITIAVLPEYADEKHSTGLTTEGYNRLSDAISRVGEIEEGPDKE